MKKILIGCMLLSGVLFAQAQEKPKCTETMLNEKVSILSCSNGENYKVIYEIGNNERNKYSEPTIELLPKTPKN